MSDYVPTKHERESAEAREALWNALGRRPDELFAIASALTAAEERGRRSAETERDELRKTIAELLPMAERAHHADLGKHLCPDIGSLPEGLRIAREGALLLRLHHPDLAPRDSAPEAAPGCLCQGGKMQPYCAYCLGMSAPRDSGKGAPVKELTREEAVAMFGPRKDRP